MDSLVLMWIRWTTLPVTVIYWDYQTNLTGGIYIYFIIGS